MTTLRFHLLKVRDVRHETESCVSLSFDVPPELSEAFRFVQGQHLSVRRNIDGEDVRRSYSICSGVDDGELRIAIKEQPGGRFSTWANRELRPGDALEVMPPDGRFFVPLDPTLTRHYAAFVAGSGITPVLSLMKTILVREPRSLFTLVYGNRSPDTVIFDHALAILKDRYLRRVALYHVFSRDQQGIDLFNGRIDRPKVSRLLDTLVPAASIDEVFICGPEAMITSVQGELEAHGLDAARIHVERFAVPDAVIAAMPSLASHVSTPAPGKPRIAGVSEITVIVDGVRHRFLVSEDGQTVLAAALQAGVELPYSCMAGVCRTCRARLVEGEVRMDANYALEEDEVENGHRLTCQAHPTSSTVVLDFDQG